MYIVVLTGGIASGKSTVRRYFESHGAMAFDLDKISREIVEPPSPQLDALVRQFGDEIVDDEGRLIRANLARVAFDDPVSTQAMNEIMLPAIFERCAEYLVSFSCSVKGTPVVFIEVPLLCEAPQFAELADEVVALEVDYETRKRRARERGMTERDFEARYAQQASDEERRALADTVIDNSGTKEELIAKLDAWWHERERQGWRSMRAKTGRA